MSAQIPPNVAESDLSRQLQTAGLKPIHQGKVSDTYELSHGLRLVVKTDRISIFDFVLPALVPDKGKILNAMTVFWLKMVIWYEPNHLEAYGEQIDPYLPKGLQFNDELRQRAMVVRTLTMLPIECIVRGYLTGSGWSAYQKTQTVCGIALPAGLHDGSILPEPLFTPTTKAEQGHDVHIDAAATLQQHGEWVANLSLKAYRSAAKYALDQGVIIADTKFEFGDNRVLGDEVLTPDSSRFWDLEEWKKASKEGQSPPARDKQFVREWGKTVGIDKLDPLNPDDVAFVHQLTVPSEILKQTAAIYESIAARLLGSWEFR